MSNLKIDSGDELDTRDLRDYGENLRVLPSIIDKRSSTAWNASVRNDRSRHGC